MPDDQTPSRRRQIEELIFVTMPHYVSGALFLVAVGINIVNVIGRYVFAKPLFWAEEILVFIVIWAVFLVAGSVTYRGAHLNMDLIYSGLRGVWKLAVDVAITIALIGCTIFVAWQSWKIVDLYYHNHGVTAGTDIPLIIPHTAVLFGFIFMAAAAIVRVRSYITGKFD
ncbi:MAG TPA: TRAP transporter small permease [Pseudolabrys sp.]|nr:TRAP transporter small permease [Pseudolabrys sp.]